MLKQCDFRCGFETEDEGELRGHHTRHMAELNRESQTKGLIEAQRANDLQNTKAFALQVVGIALESGKTVPEVMELYREALAAFMGAGQ